jgi:hypothetical protein
MVESKLVELVVAGSSPVGHPTFSTLEFKLVLWRERFRGSHFIEGLADHLEQRESIRPIKGLSALFQLSKTFVSLGLVAAG